MAICESGCAEQLGRCSYQRSWAPPQQVLRDLETGSKLTRVASNFLGKCIDCAEKGAAASAGRCCARLRRPSAQSMEGPQQHPGLCEEMGPGAMSLWSTSWEERCTLNCLPVEHMGYQDSEQLQEACLLPAQAVSQAVARSLTGVLERASKALDHMDTGGSRHAITDDVDCELAVAPMCDPTESRESSSAPLKPALTTSHDLLRRLPGHLRRPSDPCTGRSRSAGDSLSHELSMLAGAAPSGATAAAIPADTPCTELVTPITLATMPALQAASPTVDVCAESALPAFAAMEASAQDDVGAEPTCQEADLAANTAAAVSPLRQSDVEHSIGPDPPEGELDDWEICDGVSSMGSSWCEDALEAMGELDAEDQTVQEEKSW